MPLVSIGAHPFVLYVVFYLEIDVYRLVFEDLWVWLELDQSNLLLDILDKILRLLISYFFLIEAARTLPLMVLLLLVPAKLIKLSGDLLLKQSKTLNKRYT